jgi:hypothetical protein
MSSEPNSNNYTITKEFPKELPLSDKHEKKINYQLQNTSTITILEETKKYLSELKHHLGLKTWDDVARLLYNILMETKQIEDLVASIVASRSKEKKEVE